MGGSVWKSSPAVAAALLLCGGTYIARVTNAPWGIWGTPAAVFFCLSLLILYQSRSRGGRDVISSLSFSITLFFSSAAYSAAGIQLTQHSHIKHYLDTPDQLRLVCEIADEPRVKDGKTITLVHVRSMSTSEDSLCTEGDALLTIVLDKRVGEKSKEFSYGSLIAFDGTLSAPISSRNPGEFSYRDYLELNNIFATAHVFGYSHVEVLNKGNPNWFFAYIIFPSKHFVLHVINSAMTGDAANFLIGLLLGDRTDMSADLKSAFVNTGTIHVLAVSGSHVVLVVAIIYTLFGLIRLPERSKIMATILGILYYMELTGATPSVVRASLMAIVVLLAKLFQQRTNVYNSLGVSAVLLLVYDPLQMFDAGFQLSYAAVFSMVYFYPKLALLIKKIPESLEEVKAIDYVLKLFAISLSAQIGTIPFTAYFFGRVSLVSLVANLVVVPLVEIIVTVGFVAVLVGACSVWLSTCFSEVNNLLAWFTLKFVLLANAVPHATVSTATFGLKETFFYSAAVVALFNMTDSAVLKRVLFISFAAIDFLIVIPLFTHDDDALRILRVEFLDVGQGDAALIEFPTGEKFLVDAGPKTLTYDAGEKVVAPYLRRRSISVLDAIIISHPHSDHLGGVPYLLRNVEVTQVVDASQREQSSMYSDYELVSSGRRRAVFAGVQLASISNVRLYTLHPTNSFLDVDSTEGYKHLNNTSVVFKLQYGSTSFLFVGDAEILVEEQLDAVYASFLKSDVLKAGHHGSSTSSSEEFLANVQPKEVVVSVGKFNKFHHPSAKALARFRNTGAHIHRTDEEGAIIFESDGHSIKHVNWRKD
jgi:competence protein ComEC